MAIIVAIPVSCSMFVLSFVNNVMDPRSSPKRTVNAPRASVKRSGSIEARTVIDATKIATAAAILRRISVLMLVCHVSREPRTASSVPVTFSLTSPNVSLIMSIRPYEDSFTDPVRDSNQFLAEIIKPESIVELKTSTNEPKSAVPRTSPIPDVILLKAPTIAFPRLLKKFITPLNMLVNLSSPAEENSVMELNALPRASPITFSTVPNALVCVIAFEMFVRKPPNEAPNLRRLSNPPAAPFAKENIPLITLPRIVPAVFTTENTPLNVSLRLFAAVSSRIRPAVNSLN